MVYFLGTKKPSLLLFKIEGRLIKEFVDVCKPVFLVATYLPLDGSAIEPIKRIAPVSW